jgi:hypothetical protein
VSTDKKEAAIKISNSGTNAQPRNQKYGRKPLLKSLLTTKKAQRI